VNFDKNDGPIFYRLKVEADLENYLVSNPIFVRFDEVVGSEGVPVSQNEWDNVLGEYIQGQREKPVWGYGGNNYLCEEEEPSLVKFELYSSFAKNLVTMFLMLWPADECMQCARQEMKEFH
jgi:hypothetical protein